MSQYRNKISFDLQAHDNFKTKMLNWANRFSIFCLLENTSEPTGTDAFTWVAAVDATAAVTLSRHGYLQQLQQFLNEHTGWKFAHFGYELKDEIHGQASKIPTNNSLADGFVFVPRHLVTCINSIVCIESDTDVELLLKQINLAEIADTTLDASVKLTEQVNREHYIDSIEAIQQNIQAGECYELNYCVQQTGYAENVNPLTVYEKLSKQSPVPFAALYKNNQHYCICASPERFIKISGRTIMSQPIKGTAGRFLDDATEDERIKNVLAASKKDKAENVMVVDLVRNDLSRVCEIGSVQVPELFGIYSFATVHQMISTIKGTLKQDISFTDILKATFPMGSMTGAPKHRVMQLIQKFEAGNRGLFSGSLGYIQPNGDADFNVVIRSIFYDSITKKVNAFAGGGITAQSQALAEWEECALKMQSMRTVLGSD